MKHSTIPELKESPLLKLDGENNLSDNEYKIHKEFIEKEFIKKINSGEITTQQIKEVLNKKYKGEKN